MPTAVLVVCAGATMCSAPSAAHDVANSPSAPAAPVSRVRNAMTAARNSNGKTNTASRIPVLRTCSPVITPSPIPASNAIPIPKEKNPSGNGFPYGRTTTVAELSIMHPRVPLPGARGTARNAQPSRRSRTRRIFPTDRSNVSGSTTVTSADNPTPSLIPRAITSAAASRSSAALSGRASTRTAI